jgi:thioredoxin 1
VVYFSATWCGPCKFISPLFEKLSDKTGDHVVFCKVDIEQVGDVAEEVGIKAVRRILEGFRSVMTYELLGPNFHVFQGGQQSKRVLRR